MGLAESDQLLSGGGIGLRWGVVGPTGELVEAAIARELVA
jgi:hypothetical protein